MSMAVFKDLREQLAAELAEALDPVPVYASWPSSTIAPCVFLMPPLGGPYVQRSGLFGQSYILAVDAVVLVPHSTVQEAHDALEALLETVLKYSADWQLAGVDPPAAVTVTEGGAEYLGAVVHLSKAADLL
jgi:hypothetical protein